MAGETAIYGIVGENIDYSLSPAIFATLFKRHQVDAIYQRFDIGKAQLAAFVIAARTVPIAGFNVTIPHKENITQYLSGCDPISTATGSVNLVINRAGKLHGHNTDYAGVAASIEEKLALRVAGKRVIVVGSGGAARTVFYYLVQKRAAVITVLHHSPAREKSFSKWARGIVGKAIYQSQMLNKRQAEFGDADLVVNCTPELIGRLFDRKSVGAMRRVFELRYSSGRKPSKTYVSGEYMLAIQACEAYRIITGIKVAAEDMMRIVSRVS